MLKVIRTKKQTKINPVILKSQLFNQVGPTETGAWHEFKVTTLRQTMHHDKDQTTKHGHAVKYTQARQDNKIGMGRTG